MRFYRPLLLLAALLAFGVITLGAYVRLSDAGLGCPDWPGCYGHLLGVPAAADEHAAALAAFPERPLEPHKAWKEMLHRYFAGSLGLLILLIAGLAWKYRYRLRQSPALPTLLVGVVGVQALLGMWTVTLLLKPLIVTAHLLGGMSTLALLLWLLLRQRQPPVNPVPASLRLMALAALLAITLQIALGGWVSSNYAALSCSDFPTCQGQWMPETDFAQAFHVVRDLGKTAEGESLSGTALLTIQWTHRVGALILALLVGTVAFALFIRSEWRRWGLALGAVLLGQIALGVANVLWSLPLPLALAHNAGAAILLSLALALNFRLWQRSE
jgi:cytochrome c oxidase assembly protein subunit 15